MIALPIGGDAPRRLWQLQSNRAFFWSGRCWRRFPQRVLCSLMQGLATGRTGLAPTRTSCRGRLWSSNHRLLRSSSHPHASSMFCVSEAQAAIIRTAFEQRGELAAVVELRRLFPGVGSIAWARECARTVADWPPLPVHLLDRRVRASS
jgi:hypothetical protein